MRVDPSQVLLSASDLAKHLACEHVTTLDIGAARGLIEPPTFRDPMLDRLIELGLTHEAEYVEHLRASGLRVTKLDAAADDSSAASLYAAMRRGDDVIVQAPLHSGDWHGRADVLLKVPTASELGEWSYEVVDTKLTHDTKAGTILQLCLYSEMVGVLQGSLPEHMHVVPPSPEFAAQSFRVRDFLSYHRLVQRRLVAATRSDADSNTYPEPVRECDVCRWWAGCEKRRRGDDHLSLVAGITTSQRTELVRLGVKTLATLGAMPVPLQVRPKRGSAEALERVREQARVQLEGRTRATNVHELLGLEPGRGLARLPAPSPGDVFCDFEGHRFFESTGFEYLLGYATKNALGELEYRALWSANRDEERTHFEAFVDFLIARWAQFPDMHIYHFAPYEPVQLKRLMLHYATRGEEMDRLLRGLRFVDLYGVVRQSIRASVESYSIKALEVFYGYERLVELREASLALRGLERLLEQGRLDAAPSEVRADVEGYNRDDCVSTAALRDWLERLRDERVREGEVIARPELTDGAPSKERSEHQQRVDALKARLTDGIPMEASTRTDEQQARWVLAQLLDFHQREMKAVFWEYFRLRELPEAELVHERAAIGGLRFVKREEVTKRGIPTDSYRFPRQETSIRSGEVHAPGTDGKFGEVVSIDAIDGTVRIKKTGATAELHPSCVFEHKLVPTADIEAALLHLAEWVADHGVDGDSRAHRAARDLLLRLPPRLRGAAQFGVGGEEAIAAAAVRVGVQLDGGVLAIQGPPGAGKTHTGAEMICALVREGKRVGVTGPSHTVIRNLLDAVVARARTENLTVRCVEKADGESTDEILRVGKSELVAPALMQDRQVAAGTAWLWALPSMRDTVDVLFVDEAGQMSLANTLASAQGAKSVVLLGDPQQLDQPLQASHPDGADASALEHLLGEHKTMPETLGLFLKQTWRLHPAICAFTSCAFYEGRLDPAPARELQALSGPTRFAGAGLRYEEVRHEGNQSSSPEEVERVEQIVSDLLSEGVCWTDADGKTHPLALADIMIVAPYNAHVADILARIPDARVGTVDKFQGQQAPVVIYSLATSSHTDAPRGMEFLYSANRFNVATSRARCVCILVASPKLFEPECHTPRQMQLANAFCLYREMAKDGQRM